MPDKAPDPQQLEQASACLCLMRAQVDTALAQLNRLCSVDGSFSTSRLDAHQQVSYELAVSVAELEASAALVQYAGRCCAEDALCQPLALCFCADTLRSVWQRMLAQAPDCGLAVAELLAQMAAPPLANFLARHGKVEGFAALGVALQTRASGALPSGLGEEKDMIAQTFARFAEDVVMPEARQIHRFDTDIPEAIIGGAANLGCFGTCIPERFGGLMPDKRPDSLGMLVVTEELSRASLGAAGSLITRPEIAARALLAGGSPAQQQHWLPLLASGDTLAAIAITEPDYGSDVAGLALKARAVTGPAGGGWLLNGAKTWCTFAGRANVLVTLARSEAAADHRGLSLFLVEKPAFAGHEFSVEQPGGGRLSGKAIATIGYRGMHSFDLAFDNFFVPAGALVGGDAGRGKGFYLTMKGLSGGRIQTSARACGVMRSALEQAIAYATQRKVFAAPVGNYQLTQVKLGRMWAALTASRQFGYAVARLLDAGTGQMQASLVKLFSCRAAEWVTREAMQIHGGMGYAEESDVSRYFVDARVLSIFEGAEETLALKVIARDLITHAGERAGTQAL